MIPFARLKRAPLLLFLAVLCLLSEALVSRVESKVFYDVLHPQILELDSSRPGVVDVIFTGPFPPSSDFLILSQRTGSASYTAEVWSITSPSDSTCFERRKVTSYLFAKKLILAFPIVAISHSSADIGSNYLILTLSYS
jgi:hypothetical protein